MTDIIDPRETNHPRLTGRLLGHEAAEQRLINAFMSGRLHHAWLLAGPRGIGKATLAYRFARFLFANRDPAGLTAPPHSLDVAPEDAAAKLVAARSHPDLLVVQRALDLKKDPIKSGKDRIAQLKSSISVEDSRDASHFFSLSPAMGGWRVCIVDAADDLNADAANALLKVLEEPPARSVFVIVAHAPGRLLATIRSRCIKLNLQPLATEAVVEVLATLGAAPDTSADELAAIAALSQGSPGRALNLIGSQGARLFLRFQDVATRPPPFARPTLLEIASHLKRADAAEEFPVFTDLMSDWIAATARRQALSGGVCAAQPWARAYQDIGHSIRRANALNLDRRQVLLEAFATIEEAARESGPGCMSFNSDHTKYMPDKTFFITTAISYPNGPPHIGQAYEALATDALARFKRLDGYEVLFLTGTDEHGQKIQQTAEKQGKTAAQFVEEMTPLFQRMVATLNCSNDDFIRTTEPRHHRSVAELWRRMEAAGDLYLGTYSGWYSVRDEAFYGESELVERDGQKFAPSGTPVEWVEEESYFFRLSAYQERLLAHYEAHPEFIGPQERRNEVMSFVRGGLQDLSVSRTTFDWGIPVPDRPGHVMYVWVDALINYVSATGFPDPASPRAKFWPADVHIIGKDIVRFHAVYWPAILMSAGLALPKRVYGHGFLFNKGEKMSKSVGNVIDPFPLAAHYGVDQVRYFFLREVPFGQDGNYSHEAIVNRINADLANDFGNLAQRSLSMIAKNCQGRVPEPGPLSPEDEAILEAADAIIVEARQHHEVQAIHRALDAIWRVVADTNRYFAGQEPWALRKTDPQRMNTVLYVTAEVLRQLAILAQPYVPAAAERLLDLLAVEPSERDFAALGAAGRLKPGTALPGPQAIFPRYVEAETASTGT